MSQFTYSQSPLKRTRTVSQMSTSTNDNIFNLLRAPPSQLYVTPKREVGGTGVQKGGSAGKKRKVVSPGLGWINRVLFPISRFHLKNYGENYYGLVMSANRLTRAGTLKRLAGEPGKQVWFEAFGLPLYWPNIGSTVALQGVVPSNISLMDLAYHAANNKNLTTITTDTTGSNIPATINANTFFTQAGQDAYAQLFDKKICYLGGYQKHTFINGSNAHQFLEVYELHPRDIMFDWYVRTDICHFRSVGDDVIRDFAKNDNTSNYPNAATAGTVNGIDLSPSTGRYDAVDDPSVRITSRCRTVHSKYKVSKPLKITLAPGETFHYTMNFDPFTFEEGELNRYIEAVYYAGDTANHSTWTRPTSIPMFTKRLVVRAWGEPGKSALVLNSGNVTLTQAQITANKQQPTYLTNTQASLMHLQEEKHSIRYCPETNDVRDVIMDERDQPVNTDGNAWNLVVVNDEADQNEAFST